MVKRKHNKEETEKWRIQNRDVESKYDRRIKYKEKHETRKKKLRNHKTRKTMKQRKAKKIKKILQKKGNVEINLKTNWWHK